MRTNTSDQHAKGNLSPTLTLLGASTRWPELGGRPAAGSPAGSSGGGRSRLIDLCVKIAFLQDTQKHDEKAGK
eukprot:8370718-Karenia_brevis.AAC.1